MKDTWLKLHTSILTSAKFLSLPGNDHRWAFVCLLLLAKKGLESIPERQLLGHINLSKRRWRTVRKELIKSGLIDDDGKVKGFEESQLSPDAIRMRRMRERNSDVTSDCNNSTESRKQRAESREREKSAPYKKATKKEADFAIRLLKKHGVNPLSWKRGLDFWTSQAVDEVVAQYKGAPVAVGPRPADTFTDEPDLTTEDIEKGKAYLDRLNRKDGG